MFRNSSEVFIKSSKIGKKQQRRNPNLLEKSESFRLPRLLRLPTPFSLLHRTLCVSPDASCAQPWLGGGVRQGSQALCSLRRATTHFPPLFLCLCNASRILFDSFPSPHLGLLGETRNRSRTYRSGESELRQAGSQPPTT